jgi:hypothetical protein
VIPPALLISLFSFSCFMNLVTFFYSQCNGMNCEAIRLAGCALGLAAREHIPQQELLNIDSKVTMWAY